MWLQLHGLLGFPTPRLPCFMWLSTDRAISVGLEYIGANRKLRACCCNKQYSNITVMIGYSGYCIYCRTLSTASVRFIKFTMQEDMLTCVTDYRMNGMKTNNTVLWISSRSLHVKHLSIKFRDRVRKNTNLEHFSRNCQTFT
jgi:hypothetical protein